jgi:hypothetical protein
LGSRWWRHQCWSSGLEGRANRGVIGAVAACTGGGGSGTRSSFWRKKTIGPTDRAGLPISEGEAAGQARSEGGGREVGHGWAERGRERGGPWLGQKPEMAR